ncbi:hypothetical protein M5689_018731 [Euphorbia peplus]|nr:hypothetical protein M5689_018731 [Euphorbia peplus]
MSLIVTYQCETIYTFCVYCAHILGKYREKGWSKLRTNANDVEDDNLSERKTEKETYWNLEASSRSIRLSNGWFFLPLLSRTVNFRNGTNMYGFRIRGFSLQLTVL